jgi:uncharacterized membrane protein
MQEATKYKAKVFLASLCTIFATQVLFKIEYEDNSDSNFVIRLVVAALLSIGFTFFWGQFKKP